LNVPTASRGEKRICEPGDDEVLVQVTAAILTPRFLKVAYKRGRTAGTERGVVGGGGGGRQQKKKKTRLFASRGKDTWGHGRALGGSDAFNEGKAKKRITQELGGAAGRKEGDGGGKKSVSWSGCMVT